MKKFFQIIILFFSINSFAIPKVDTFGWEDANFKVGQQGVHWQ